MQTAIETPTTNQSTIPLALIAPGDNPRKYFDQAKMDELIASIRESGVYQPILVRPIEGGYKIVAGERRYRASLAVYGEEGSIPAVVKEMSDEEADKAALVENTQRDDMSVTEEADAASKILEQHNGNREETAAILGWPQSKLTRRLALLNLTEAVKTALNERRIMVGHAELLAGVPQDKQDKALSNIIERKLSVLKVRDMLDKSTMDFKRAVFDTTACGVCIHNSSQQADLFTVAVEQGRCTNGDCYKAKTKERIAELKNEVEEEFPNVRVIEIGDPANYVAITADGDLGVGGEQLEACKGCGNYGATISAIPGEEGKVESGICFDAACHQKKVALRIKAQKAAKEAEKGGPATRHQNVTASAKAVTKKSASTLSEKVKDYRRKTVWNMVAEKELLAQPSKASSFLLDLLLTGHGSKVNSHALIDSFNQKIGEKAYHMGDKGHPDKAHALLPEHKRQIFTEAAASAVVSIEEERLKGLLTFLDADISKYWEVCGDFLSLLTKSEIESVCTDIGLSSFMPDFKKVIGGKKEEAIKAIMSSGFTFTGKIPSILTYQTTTATE